MILLALQKIRNAGNIGSSNLKQLAMKIYIQYDGIFTQHVFYTC